MADNGSKISGGDFKRPFEPIAIVGMACRFPGASDLNTFWDQLISGTCATFECPPGRQDGRVGQLYADTAACPSACRFGAFLTDIDQFDAEFFRISPSEAEFLDPQQRMMLETSWKALEDAGIDPETLRGSSASVYAGMSNNDYRYLILDGADTSLPATSLYTITGTSLNTAIGRVSYVLGLEGPAMTVDTACSSSLVAMHEAVAALHRGETDIALAGGVQLILSGKLTELRANAGMLSPDGTCKTFDATANGYVRGEGCGMVVLKRLDDAKRDGDHIWAVVAATAINQDGTSDGLTVPRGTAQRAVIEEALSRSQLAPTDINYLEAHGTGTPVGDPVEINAAAQVYGEGRTPDEPLLIGSVKTNIGHLEPAAGIAGVIKTALAIKTGVIPKHLNFSDPNPAIEWDELPVKVTSETMAWPDTDGKPRVAGINSFGFSGTNAHVLLQGHEQTREPAPEVGDLGLTLGPDVQVDVKGQETNRALGKDATPSKRTKRILPLSAKSPAALEQLAGRYRDSFNAHALSEQSESDSFVSDFCWSAGVGRGHFNYRKAVVFEDLASLLGELDSLSAPDVYSVSPPSGKIAFAYTGQGSQWVGMGRSLYDTEPVFRSVIDECEQVMQKIRNTSLIDRLFGLGGDENDLEDPTWVQPCIYAIECALTDLWRSLGVEPQVVLGHSLGEIAAARTAGVWSLESGLRFAATRGALMSNLPGPGAMAAVFLPEDDAQALVEDYNNKLNGVGVSIAALNGAHQVFSGLEDELTPLLDDLERDEVRVRRLKKSPAYHSALVEPILDDLAEFVAGLEVHESKLDLISNVSGEIRPSAELLNADYWRGHARQSVAYRKSVESLANLGVSVVIEIGPNSVLAPMTQMAWPDAPGADPVVLASMQMPRDNHPEIPRDGGFFESVAEAYTRGLNISFNGLFAGETCRKIGIPGYPFQRARHWVESKRRHVAVDDHPLLGSKRESPRGETFYEVEMFPSEPAWLNEHRVFGHVLMPGAMYGSMALSVLPTASGKVIDDLQLLSPMVFKEPTEDDDEVRKVQTVVEAPDAAGMRAFEIYSKGSGDDGWTMHASGSVSSAQADEEADRLDLSELTSTLTKLDVGEYYSEKSASSIDLGQSFRTLKSIWSDGGSAVAEVAVDQNEAESGVDIHPLILDGCFQTMSAARNSAGIGGSATYIPFGWERLTLHRKIPANVICHARVRDFAEDADENEKDLGSAEALSGDVRIYDTRGYLLAELDGFVVKRATRASLLSAIEDIDDLIYEVVWRPGEHLAHARRKAPLPVINEITSAIDPFFDYLEAQGVKPSDRSELLVDLGRFAHSVIFAALDNSEWDWCGGKPFNGDTLIERMGYATKHRKLVNRMLHLLEQANVLTKESDGSFVFDSGRKGPPPNIEDPQVLAQELFGKHPHGEVELTLLSRFGNNLNELLRDDADPLALLFDENELGAEDLYKVAPISIAGNRVLGDVIGRIVGDLPSDRLVRIIEVGAGTGATTEIVFAELGDTRVEYMFTDISAGFFSEAERRFEGNGLDIEYQALDIETDPTSQGFQGGYYDIVIAANVLHATRNLHETLSHCRELLAPGGVLIALESLRGRAWQDLTFGFLDGWWRYEDDYRENHAIASPDIWLNALKDAGYAEAHVFGDEVVSESVGPLGSGTIVGKAPDDIVLPKGTWVVEPEDGQISTRLCTTLSSMKQRVVITHRDDLACQLPRDCYDVAVSHDELPGVFAALREDEPLRGIVHLGGLSSQGVGASTPELAADVTKAGASALSLVQVLMDTGVSPTQGTWFVTRGAQVVAHERNGDIAGSTLWGVGKVVALEAAHLVPRMVDLDPNSDSFQSLLDELLWPDDENHIAYRGAERYSARLVRGSGEATHLPLPDEPHWLMNASEDGSLQNVRTETITLSDLEAWEVRVQVEACGLNFSDVLVALGAQTPGASLGLEFSGRILEVGSEVDGFTTGQRVLGMGFGTFGPVITTHSSLVAAAPSNLDFNELATIPIVFTTAAMAFDLAKLKSGDRVLVHSAAGGVGLAAVQLAQACGAEVYATASQPKQAFVRAMGVEHVFDSRSLDFGDKILAATEGKGVDVVLNSLTSEGFIETSLACLKQGGRFVEIARLDILTPDQMNETRPDVDYHILSLDELKRNEPDLVGESFKPLMQRFDSSELKPLHYTKWSMMELGQALQYMGSARHIGKLVLTVPKIAHGQLNPDRTYLITGGMGGIGCTVANWLVDRGARHLVLNGRRGPDEDAEATIEQLREGGVHVEVKIADVTDPILVDKMLQEIDGSMPALGGVIHSVGVLSDGSLLNQTWERFEEVLWPKVLGAWHLHRSTRDRDLDHFVLFSSVTGVIGNAGQANHAAANAFLDQLAAHRRAMGLPGQSIAWGAWSSIGEAAEQRERIASQLEATGTGWISPQMGIKALDRLVAQDFLNPTVLSMDWSMFEQNLAGDPPLFRELLGSLRNNEAEEESGTSLNVDELKNAGEEDRLNTLIPYLQQQLQSVLRLPSVPSPSVGFFDLGMDSLMAVELRNRLIRVFEGEFVVSKTAVFDYPNVDALANHLSNELGEDQESVESHADTTRSIVSLDGDSDVAVIGLACRFPGASNHYEYWNNLEAGVDCMAEHRGVDPKWKGFVGDSSSAEEYMRAGGFVEELDGFDSRFFRIRPIEARMMDPRQRMLLETCWEAIENAAIDADSLRGGRVGVYVGLGGSEYRDLVNAGGYEDSYLGTSSGMTTGRISYILGLMGPAMSFDLACASSLVAIHEGVGALQRGEVDVALVGGANAILSPSIMRFHREIGLLSPSGKCRAFDADADGYMRGEGCGILVLKRLTEAEESGDPIWSLVRGSAVNQNGASAGLTVPNGMAQEQVIRDAVNIAGIDPSELDYLETHGMGLTLSDPIEVRAASAVYSSNRDPSRELLIGSVKSSIGHLEWAAGIAGVIKVILSMNKKRIPRQVHFEQPNDQIDWNDSLVRVNKTLEDWPESNGREPLAAVSAFGMSGTNAHVIMQGYSNGPSNGNADAGSVFCHSRGIPVSLNQVGNGNDGNLPKDLAHIERPVRFIPLSGKTESSVYALAQRYVNVLESTVGSNDPDEGELNDWLANLAWTACVGRRQFENRKGLVFRDFDSLMDGLRHTASQNSRPINIETISPPKTAFVFSGAGDSLLRFGQLLYQSEPTFRCAVDQCLGGASDDLQWSDVIEGALGESDSRGDSRITDSFIAAYAIQTGLVNYWSCLGIKPDYVIGSGVGEITACCVSGALKSSSGLEIVSGGAGSEDSNNGNSLGFVDETSLTQPSIPIVASATGAIAKSTEELAAVFDELQLDASSRELNGLETLARLGVGCVIHIGASQSFAQFVKDAWSQVDDEPPLVIDVIAGSESLESAESCLTGVLQAVKEAYEGNLPLRLSGLFDGETRSRVSLPTYPFEHRNYWFNMPLD